MELLLEIMVEELPPSHVKTAVEDLRERLLKELASARIAPMSFRVLSTCRRLVVSADLPEGQAAGEQVVIGPPKSAAFAPDGTPTPAALGFARARGVDVSRLEIIRTEKGEYVGFRTVERGESSAGILNRVIPQVVVSLSFPKMMRWGESQFRFSRPIRNVLADFGGAPLSFEIAGIAAGTKTRGHKIRSPKEIEARSFTEYEAALKANLVTVDPEERKRSILSQVEARLAPLKAELYPDPELLDKLANDVECPLVFLGTFPEAYLSLPLEILSTAMREGLKVFSVVKGASQLPVFLGVADSPADEKGLIRTGFERVLKARLEDAKFFWDQDLKTPLRKRVPALKHVLFQEKLGSYDDKVERLKKISAYLGGKLAGPADVGEIVQAAALCKADLVTEMVREFPSLQGRVGGLYARAEGQPETVTRAIYEHYQPAGLDDASPASLGGAVLSIADKMDSIVGVVGIGIQTTGSRDPFALRRNAQGICKVVLDRKLDFSFPRLVERVLAIYGVRLKRPKAEILDYIREFFSNRLRYLFERDGYRYDLANAALGAGLDNLLHVSARVKALDALKSSPEFEPFILMAKRTSNILAGVAAAGVPSADLLVEKAERDLHSIFTIVRDNVDAMLAKGDYIQAQKLVFRLQPALNAFFDEVLVMDKDLKLRKNRLAVLQAIRKILGRMADYSQVVVVG
jgi:glycyl-tRNA synthetase beta chain